MGDRRVNVAFTTSRQPHKQPNDHLSTGNGVEQLCTKPDLEPT